MSVIIMTKDNLPKTIHELGTGASSISYKTDNGLVLKRYCNNETYKKINEIHKYHFLDYLVELSKLESSILVVPKDIYINEPNMVAAQTYPYQVGMTLNEMYPKTNVANLYKALEEFYNILIRIDYLKLRDMHYKNIIYTGSIKLLDLDFSLFTNEKNVVKENLAHINEYIIKGIFKIDPLKKIEVDSNLQELLNSSLNGEINALEFLLQYQKMLIDKNGVCQYVKHLSKDFIK